MSSRKLAKFLAIKHAIGRLYRFFREWWQSRGTMPRIDGPTCAFRAAFGHRVRVRLCRD